MRIAVTGGHGFIGQATIAAAEKAGHTAWSVDRSNGYTVVVKDSLNGGLGDADVVIHLAGVLGTSELFDAPVDAVNVNIVGSLNVLQWCRENGAGYVGITMHQKFPSVYSATKDCAHRLASAWHRAYGVPVSHVRAYNAYGPGQKFGPGHPQKVVPTFATYGWQGRPLPVWGDGEQTMDLIHADDVGVMLVDACEHGDDAVFDAGTGREVSVNELARFIFDVTGSTAGIEYLPMRVGETKERIFAEGAGWHRLGWRPTHSWDRIAETIRSYR